MFPKNSPEYELLTTLDTPQKVQTFLDALPFNHEQGGETCMSPLRVLRERKAHCIEGALLASVCFMRMGRKPLIANLKVMESDYDHIVAIFTENGYYGAVSKTNHPVLLYRDPIYRSVRELMMTYYHELFLYTTGEKTLLGYTKPINTRRFGSKWITAEEDLWDIAEIMYDAPILPMVPEKNRRFIRDAQDFERRALDVEQWER